MEFALDKNNEPTIARGISAEAWDALKASYQIGDFRMPCCEAPAVLKTSPNGHHFFAHYTDECTSAPETIWHLNAKQLVAAHLRSRGIECQPEQPGRPSGGTWIADIFFTYDGRQIALELQHSYQSLADYRKRQVRYHESAVECFWLLYSPRYSTLIHSMAKWRIKHEFSGECPKTGIMGCVPDIPVALLETEPDLAVRGVGHLDVTLGDWIAGILERRFQWNDGAWLVSANEVLPARDLSSSGT